uniref:8.9 kDa family member n=1 Tax=Rhipicephalus appendiculatus TaxID=34631 RepID=A0A131Z7G3_RHIAP
MLRVCPRKPIPHFGLKSTCPTSPCHMILKGIVITWVSWLSLVRASYENVRYVDVPNVNVTNRSCIYNNENITDQVDDGNNCERRECYPTHKKVVLMSCHDPKPGCRLESNRSKQFPDCCRTVCFNTSACPIPGGDLLRDGEARNLSKPCGHYQCKNGILNITGCPEETDQRCTYSFGKDQPFPNCCGIGRLCTATGEKKRRKRNKGEGRKGKKEKKKLST